MLGDRTMIFGFFILSIPLFVPFLRRKLLDTRRQEEQLQVELNNYLWSELDPNLLGKILEKLCLADQLRFHVVCKNWLHARPVTTVKNPLLWYLSFDRSLFELKLHDPSSYSDPASVQHIPLTQLGIPFPPSYENVRATLLDLNWLFIIIAIPKLFFWKSKYILLFSPLTKKIIPLPKFGYPCTFAHLTVLMSSTQPESPDCVFFLLDTTCKNSDKVIYIITYHNGDKEWTAKEFSTRLTNFKPCPCWPVYLDGILYIVSPFGQLASYDGELKFESLLVDALFRRNIRSSRQMRAFELNGELMAIYFDLYKNKDATLPGKPCIRRYSWSNKVWIPVSSLGDKSLLFSEKTYQVVVISSKDDDMRNSGVLSDKIYQFSDDGCLIYSIEEDGELTKFKSIDSNLLEEGDSSDHLPVHKYKRGTGFLGSTKALYWLQPPTKPVKVDCKY